MSEIYCSVTGVVQRVAYRTYVQDAATKLELTGWVQNMPDGSVSVLAQGAPEVLKELIEYLHEGSLRAQVASVAVEWRTLDVQLDEFSISHA